LDSNNLASRGTNYSYYPKIDTLRAIAVLLVLFHHYFNEKITHWLSLGGLGVDIFFTISGFLITGILFSYKEKLSFSDSLKIFYIRRILRIFPIYYLYIGAVALIFGSQISHSHLIWASLFCENFYIISGGKTNEALTHFWSLAVEEQFYLIWPFLILVVNRRFAKSLIIFFIFFSFIFSVLNILIFKINYVEYMHPLSCFLSLALGG
jgi:peptidoglycan/LPS O-acetylase OafA/YrhL